MNDLNALYKKLNQIDEQPMSDIEKYRLGQMSLADLKKSEEFRRMPPKERWEQGIISRDDYERSLTPMDKYRMGLINKDELAKSQAVQPVYPELAAAGLGGAIRAGLGLLGRRGAETAATAAKQAGTKVEPTLAAPKPRIEIRPGETPAQAIARTQKDMGLGPKVWRDPVTGQMKTTPGRGAPQTSPAPAKPDFKSGKEKNDYFTPPGSTKMDKAKAIAGSIAANTALLSPFFLTGRQKPGQEIQEPGTGEKGSPQGRTSPNVNRPIEVELIPGVNTPEPTATRTGDTIPVPDIVIDKTNKPTSIDPVTQSPTPAAPGPRPSQPAPSATAAKDLPAVAPSTQTTGGPTTQRGTPPTRSGTPYDIEKEFTRAGYKESLIREFQTYVDLKSKVRFKRK